MALKPFLEEKMLADEADIADRRAANRKTAKSAASAPANLETAKADTITVPLDEFRALQQRVSQLEAAAAPRPKDPDCWQRVDKLLGEQPAAVVDAARKPGFIPPLEGLVADVQPNGDVALKWVKPKNSTFFNIRAQRQGELDWTGIEPVAKGDTFTVRGLAPGRHKLSVGPENGFFGRGQPGVVEVEIPAPALT